MKPKMKLNAETRIHLCNGNYDVTIMPEKQFSSRAQYDAFVRREVRLLDETDEDRVREQYENALREEDDED